MKKILLILFLLTFGVNAYAATRTIRTYRPIPYRRTVSPFVRPYNSYNNRFYGNNYNRNYNRAYYNNRYYNSGYNYYPQRRGIFSGLRIFSRPAYRNNYYYRPVTTSGFRFGSCVKSPVVPISYKADLKDPRVSLVEKNVYGKSFEHQEMNLRLNRLEKSMFNKTYPSMSIEERIENIFVNYNGEVREVSPKQLNSLEKKVFKRTYDNDSDIDRVSRLEEHVLGAIQQGDINLRMDKLKAAIAGRTFTAPVEAPYGTCYGGYMPQMHNNTGWRGALSSLGSIFTGGYPTGYTPQIAPYDSFHFGMEDSGNSQMYADNYGYMYNNTRTGTGSGIQILD